MHSLPFRASGLLPTTKVPSPRAISSLSQVTFLVPLGHVDKTLPRRTRSSPEPLKMIRLHVWSLTPCQTRYQKYGMLNSLFLTILEIGYPKFQKASGFAQDHPVNNPRTRGFRTSPTCSQISCICEKVPCTYLLLTVGKD